MHTFCITSLRVGHLDHTPGEMLSVGTMWSLAVSKFQGDHLGQMFSRHSMCSWFISDFYIYFMLHWNAWSHWDSCTKHRKFDFLATHIVRSLKFQTINPFRQSGLLCQFFLSVLFPVFPSYPFLLFGLFVSPFPLSWAKQACKKRKVKNSFKIAFLLQLWPELWVVCF